MHLGEGFWWKGRIDDYEDDNEDKKSVDPVTST